MIEIVHKFGVIAGIGGLGLAVILLIFKSIVAKGIFPMLSQKQAYNILMIIIILTFSISFLSLGAWLWSDNQKNVASQKKSDPEEVVNKFKELPVIQVDSLVNDSLEIEKLK